MGVRLGLLFRGIVYVGCCVASVQQKVRSLFLLLRKTVDFVKRSLVVNVVGAAQLSSGRQERMPPRMIWAGLCFKTKRSMLLKNACEDYEAAAEVENRTKKGA